MLACLCAGCFLRARPPVFVDSGFLSDYSLLTEAGGDRAQLLYRSADADFAAYDKILFERVTIWVAHAGEREKLAGEDFEHLADSMYATIHAALEQDYELVHEPGPGVLRIHMALTHVSDAAVTHDVFSSEGSPDHQIAADRGDIGASAEAFVNEAYLELEIVDAETDRTLVEAVDPWTRQTHLERGSITTWQQAHEAFEFWADRLRTRLAQARRGEI